MLTKLRLKNWRSLRDVEIPLSPLTVFIGANSSGKSNILDALHFLRFALEKGIPQAIYKWQGYANLHTLGVKLEEPIELGFSFRLGQQAPEYTYTLIFEGSDLATYWFREELSDSQRVINERAGNSGDDKLPLGEVDSSLESNNLIRRKLQYVLTHNWQLLSADFTPPTRLPSAAIDSLTVLDPQGQNLLFVLDFLRQTEPHLYDDLHSNLTWLVRHVEKLAIVRSVDEIRLLLHEKPLGGQLAPVVSTGTLRILAVLTALYSLRRSQDLPVLAAIEEPDTAIHPHLLSRLVEDLRNFVEPFEDEPPRQILLTTQNHYFLNLFQPEEIRIVERDETGITTVSLPKPAIVQLWTDAGEYGIGEVWLTNALGGTPN